MSGSPTLLWTLSSHGGFFKCIQFSVVQQASVHIWVKGKATMFSGVNAGDDFNRSQHEEPVIVAHMAPRKPRAMWVLMQTVGEAELIVSVWLVSAGHSGELD